mgnify:CR=1 FL=1
MQFGRYLVQKYTLDVSVEDIFGNGLGDRIFKFFQSTDISAAHIGGDFIADVD